MNDTQTEYKRHYTPYFDGPHRMAQDLRSSVNDPYINEIYQRYKNSRQRLYRFENNYGASVIQDGAFSWFLETHPNGMELAVLDYHTNEEGDLCYSTPVTDDVMNLESEDELQEILDQIAGL